MRTAVIVTTREWERYLRRLRRRAWLRERLRRLGEWYLRWRGVA